MKEKLESAFEIKTDIIGYQDEELKQEGKILNRLISVDHTGWKLEANPRHAELLIEDLGVKDGKGLSTPGIEEKDSEGADQKT